MRAAALLLVLVAGCGPGWVKVERFDEASSPPQMSASGDGSGGAVVGTGGAPGDVASVGSGGSSSSAGGDMPDAASDGDAAPACDGPTQAVCNGSCVDTSMDAHNCGGCGVECPLQQADGGATWACLGGRCWQPIDPPAPCPPACP